MAKINVVFNNTNYSIDETNLSAVSNALKSHLSTVMNGSGASIALGGASYNIDSTKLSTATNDFVSYLGTIAGSGSKVVVGGVEYNIDSAKIATAISEMASVLGGLHSEGGSSDLGEVILVERQYSFIADDEAGILTTATDGNFVNFSLTIGNTYKVVLDGEEYTCIANVYNNHIYMGNLSMGVDGAENTGELFLVHLDDVGNPAIFIQGSNSVHTVGIYKISGIDAVLAELEYFFYDTGNGLYATNIEIDSHFVDFSLASGNTYKVVWDDEEYIRVAGDVTGYNYIGNLAIMGMGENTGEPFVIGVDPSVNHAIIYTLEAGNNSMHTVGIYKQ